jgi:hypothetical protein
MSDQNQYPGGGTTRPVKPQPPSAPTSAPPLPWVGIAALFVVVALVMLGLGFLLGSASGGDDDEGRIRETVVVQPPDNAPARLTEVARSNSLATENAVLNQQLLDTQHLAATLDVSARELGLLWDESAATIRALQTQVAATTPPLQATTPAPGTPATATDDPDTDPTVNPALVLNPAEVRSATQPGVVYPYVLQTDGQFVLDEAVSACGRIRGRITAADTSTDTAIQFTVLWSHSTTAESGSISTVSSSRGPGSFTVTVEQDEVDGVFTIALEDANNTALAAPVAVRFPTDCSGYSLTLTFVPREDG